MSHSVATAVLARSPLSPDGVRNEKSPLGVSFFYLGKTGVEGKALSGELKRAFPGGDRSKRSPLFFSYKPSYEWSQGRAALGVAD